MQEIVAAGYSRMQPREGTPQLVSRIDRAFSNAPVQELIRGGALATYTTSACAHDIPSDRSPLEVRVFPHRYQRRRSIPHSAPDHPLLHDLGEVSPALHDLAGYARAAPLRIAWRGRAVNASLR